MIIVGKKGIYTNANIELNQGLTAKIKELHIIIFNDKNLELERIVCSTKMNKEDILNLIVENIKKYEYKMLNINEIIYKLQNV